MLTVVIPCFWLSTRNLLCKFSVVMLVILWIWIKMFLGPRWGGKIFQGEASGFRRAPPTLLGGQSQSSRSSNAEALSCLFLPECAKPCSSSFCYPFCIWFCFLILGWFLPRDRLVLLLFDPLFYFLSHFIFSHKHWCPEQIKMPLVILSLSCKVTSVLFGSVWEFNNCNCVSFEISL